MSGDEPGPLHDAVRQYRGEGEPSALWTLDFKGQFRTRDGHYCYPLTVADDYSRYLFGCQALLQPTRALVRPVLKWGAVCQLRPRPSRDRDKQPGGARAEAGRVEKGAGAGGELGGVEGAGAAGRAQRGKRHLTIT
jgi:transposase InsO family protein